MADTTHLILPLLAAAQAQKHVTHNEALLRLDAIVQLAVVDRDLTAPPANPSDGDRYIPASGATGAWAAWDLNVAWYVDGVWTKLVPREGWRVWVKDEGLLLVWDGAAWQQVAREVLTADRTYFVNGTTGDDGDDGLSSGSAFATITKALQTVEAIDLGGKAVKIEVAAGTYAENLILRPAITGTVLLRGDPATPANVVVQPASGTCIQCTAAADQWTVNGIKVAGSNNGIESLGFLRINNIDFASSGAVQLRANAGGTVWVDGNYAITSSASEHIRAANQGRVIMFSKTVTLPGTPAFSTAFARTQNGAFLRIDGMTFSGSATGKRFSAESLSGINTGGGGANYLPGNAAGTTTDGGQYV